MMQQGTPEWYAARLGKVTASCMNKVTAKLKGGGEAADRKNYRAQLVVERLTGLPAETYCNGAMQRGIELEPRAREAYEFPAGVEVVQVGFIDHPLIPMSGASPDGLIGDDGLLEIKCPNTATHIEYLLAGTVPAEYLKQMQWQMDCTGRQWCDFVSYDDRMPVELQLFTVRCNRDESMISELRAEVVKFLGEVDVLEAKLRARM